MRVTRRQLRKIIKEALLVEKSIANVSDLTRNKAIFQEWADLLLDELTDNLPNGSAIDDLDSKKRDSIINDISSAVIKYLIGAFGYPQDDYSYRKLQHEKDAAAAKRHKDRIMRGLR